MGRTGWRAVWTDSRGPRRAAGLAAVTAGVGLALATGCASIPAPDRTVARAEGAVRAAERANAQRYAPLELREASERLQQARTALADDEFLHARRLAEQALVQARLAEELALAARAERNAEDLQAVVSALRSRTDHARRAREPASEASGSGAAGADPAAGGAPR